MSVTWAETTSWGREGKGKGEQGANGRVGNGACVNEQIKTKTKSHVKIYTGKKNEVQTVGVESAG